MTKPIDINRKQKADELKQQERLATRLGESMPGIETRVNPETGRAEFKLK